MTSVRLIDLLLISLIAKYLQLQNRIFNFCMRKIYKENGLYQANRLLERIRAIYNKGISWGLDINNPSNSIKKYPEKSRERFIHNDEMHYFLTSLAREKNEITLDYIAVSLLTGVRRSNVLSMKKEQLRLERAQWHTPGTKNGDSLTIPLVPEAVKILEKRIAKSNSDYIFPSAKSAKGYLSDPKKPWKRVMTRATLYF